MVESAVQLVDRMRPESVADFGTVERNPENSLLLPTFDVPVVGEVGEVIEAGNRFPEFWIEWCSLRSHELSISMAYVVSRLWAKLGVFLKQCCYLPTVRVRDAVMLSFACGRLFDEIDRSL